MTPHAEGVPSHAAIAGHPLHPIVVPFPIAFWIGALITDIVFLNTQNAFWAGVSFWLIVFGLIGAAVAAVLGMIDFIKIGQARGRDGWIHAGGNVVATGLAVVNWAVRLDAPAAAIPYTGLVLSIIIVALLGITGWYGGELIYRHLVGIKPSPAAGD